MRNQCFKAVSLALGLSLAPLAAAQAEIFTRSGDQVPGAADGTLLDRLCQLTFDTNGTSLLRSILTGTSVATSDDEGALLAGNRSALLAREGSAAPGTPDLFNYVKPASINAEGDVVLSASLTGPGVTAATDAGLWLDESGALSLLARKGDNATGLTAGNLFGDFRDSSLNDAGTLAFLADISTGGRGLWFGPQGSVSPAVISGDAAPGTTSTISNLRDLRLNNADEVAFWASLTGGGATSADDTGLWSGTTGSLALVAREGDAAPGLGSVAYGEFAANRLDLNASGDVAFESQLTGSGVNNSNRRALWLSGISSTGLVARTGSLAPGTSASFGGFQHPVLSDSGNLAFLGLLNGTFGDRGIWTGNASGLTLAARFGDQAPGAAAGQTLFNFFDLNLNASDELVFGGVLTGAGVTPADDRGVWGGVAGDLRLIAREGDVLPVEPGLDLTIQSFPPRVTLNDAGQISIPVKFTDGSYALLQIDLRAKDEVLADFGSTLGLWTRQGDGTWRRLHQISPESKTAGHLDNDPREELVSDFGASLGLWIYRNDAGWERLHRATAEIMLTARVDLGPETDTVIDFGPSLGLWARLNDTTWRKLHRISPEDVTTGDLDGNGQDEVIADFGNLGLWVFRNNTAWERLRTTSPRALAVGDLDTDGRDDLVVDFGTQGVGGLWIRFNDSTWTRIHRQSPTVMAAANLDGGANEGLVAGFGSGIGLWFWRDGTWRRLHRNLPEDLATADVDRNGKDDLVVDFGAVLGLWVRVNDSSWTRLHRSSPETIAGGNLDNR